MSEAQIILQKSTVKNKKFTVIILKDGKKKTLHFGDSRYSDFTQHKDINRQRLYKLRHQNDDNMNYLKSGFWSWWILWNQLSLDQSIKDTEQKFNITIKNNIQ